jgi:hypothetical protein
MITGGQTVHARRMIEQLMVDRCKIETGDTATGEFDEDTGTYPDAQPVFSYEGPCRLKAANTASNEIEAGSQLLVETGLVLSLPVSTSGNVLKNHVAVITEVDPVSGDPALVGKRFRIEGPHVGTSATARRLRVELTT